MSKQKHSALIELQARIIDHLSSIYPDSNAQELSDSIIEIMDYGNNIAEVKTHTNLWDQNDIVVITYGDSIKKQDELPLQTLHAFFNRYLKNTINTVHILPFYPYSSDDGFSVINYCEINQSLGDWDDITDIAGDFKLMSDLVINHCSSRSLWFDNFKQRKHPGMDYFVESDPDVDLSNVVRPRTSPLLRETETLDGVKYVWCTFSHDQVDLNFTNPDVLFEFLKVIKLYLDQGVSLFRLDAVAFLWKQVGTSCINLNETHEIVRLLRLIIEHYDSRSILITETNIPNKENLSYFGNANEAHLIYNFTLPPLILYTLLSGTSKFLKQWMMSMPPAQNGTTYFNFIASHDGIGLRPVEGILSEEQVDDLAELMKKHGGDVSYRAIENNEYRPYELNITLRDALKGTFDGEDDFLLPRFICAHAIMLALEGIPAFYIHSLFATQNDHQKMDMTSNKRSINRHNWSYEELVDQLQQPESLHHLVYTRLSELVQIRKQQKAFHPNATQFTMHFDEKLFAFWRQSHDRTQSIFCIYNVSKDTQEISIRDINLVEVNEWKDLVTHSDITDFSGTITLSAYEFVWISNI